MKKVPIILFILLFSMPAFSQSATINGTVIDLTSRTKIENVKVSIENLLYFTKKNKRFAEYQLTKEVYTNKEGKFSIEHLEDGEYRIICEKEIDEKRIIKGRYDYGIKITQGKIYKLVYPADSSLIDSISIGLHIPKTCPICQKNDEVIPIRYGKGSYIEEAKRGEVHLRNCVPSHEKWYCKREKNAF